MGKSDSLKPWVPFRTCPRFLNMGLFLLVLGGLTWLWQGVVHLDYAWNFAGVKDFIVRDAWEAGLLLRGFAMTVRLGLWSLFFAIILGGGLGMLAARGSLLTQGSVQIYVNLVRNTPPLILLFLLYFIVGMIFPVLEFSQFITGLDPFWQNIFSLAFAAPDQLDRMLAAILTLTLYEGAYVTEIVRSSLASTPKGQWEAADALGLSPWLRMRLIILPQAVPIIMPPLLGVAVSTFKDSALAALISLPELTFQSLEVMAVSGMTYEVWLCAAGLYLVLGLLVSLLSRVYNLKYTGDCL